MKHHLLRALYHPNCNMRMRNGGMVKTFKCQTQFVVDLLFQFPIQYKHPHILLKERAYKLVRAHFQIAIAQRIPSQSLDPQNLEDECLT